MAKVKCATCKGTKKRLGMGGIIKDCAICAATGFVEVQEAAQEVVVTPKVDHIPDVPKMVEPVATVAEVATLINAEIEASDRIDGESNKQTLPKKKARK